MIDNILAAVAGSFLVLARFRFFWDPAAPAGFRWFPSVRFLSLKRKMEHCGWRIGSEFWAWYVATVEVLGGALFALDIARPIVGPLIFALLLGATKCTAKSKVMEQHPVDCLDVACAYMWRVEGLYILLVGLVVWEDWKWLLIA